MAALPDNSELLKRLREFAVLNSSVRMGVIALLRPSEPHKTFEELKKRLENPDMLRAMGIPGTQPVNLDYHLRILMEHGYVSVEPSTKVAYYGLGTKGTELYKKHPDIDDSEPMISLA